MGFLTKSRGKKRKFKPPKLALQPQTQQTQNLSNSNTNQPPKKKQKINESPTTNRFFKNKNKNNNNNNNNNSSLPKPKRNSFRKPRQNSSESPMEYEAKKKEFELINNSPTTWAVFHCKRSNKKHKNYLDGILRRDGKKIYLYDVDSGKQITSALWRNEFKQKIDNEEALFFGSFQVEIDRIIDNKQYESGQCFNSSIITNSNNSNNRSFKPIKINNNNNNSKRKRFKIPSKIGENGVKLDQKSEYNRDRSVKPITDPLKISNPLVLNAINLNSDYSPKTNINGSDLRAVCVAKFLSTKLRSHQTEGILFMYKCIMGISNGYNQCGVILADEMGLGKTLQTIVLIYTLINDGPFRVSAIKKAIIVTPSSLVGNWRKEFLKWISMNRRGKCCIIAMDEKKKSKRDNIIESFCGKNSNKTVLIIGYEMLRSYINLLCKIKIGLIVCDEGHRLKNSRGNQTISALNKISTLKRILLTGTPIQNNLSELYAMCNWVNPNCLNSMNHFKNTYGRPIEKSRDANCSKSEKRTGDERSNALNKITKSFILRRTSEAILRKYLKPKDEYIIFHSLSPIQISLYKSILNNKTIKSIVSTHNVSAALQCILYIRICCSSPRLSYNKILNASNSLNLKIPKNIKKQFNGLIQTEEYYSEKIKILVNLLKQCKDCGDKIVIVSNFTSILDTVQSVIIARNLRFLRLDGSTSQQQRTKLVATFNSKYNMDDFIFLLSAKAGGMGLNLIGANRLVLLDPDWNPATDQQCMARIWRDGQKKKCKIYRFITIGSIEEKILQRQIMKLEVADSVVDRNGAAKHKHKDRHFTKHELKQIFTLKTDINIENKCETIDIMKETMKEWRVCSNSSLIKTIIPMDNDKQIPVIFQRSIDPKIDPISKWEIKVNNDDNNDDDNDDEEIKKKQIEEYRDSDMDSEDEYVLKEININQDNDNEDEEDEDVVIMNKNKKKRNRFFDDESDSDNEEELRILKHKREDTANSNISIDKEEEEKEEEIEKQIKNITQETQGSINDLDINFDF